MSQVLYTRDVINPFEDIGRNVRPYRLTPAIVPHPQGFTIPIGSGVTSQELHSINRSGTTRLGRTALWVLAALILWKYIRR